MECDLPEQLEPFAPAYRLCEDISLLELEYWEPFKKEWIPEWSTIRNDAQPDRLPERVKITIGFVNEDGDTEKFTTQTIIYLEEKVDASRGQ